MSRDRRFNRQPLCYWLVCELDGFVELGSTQEAAKRTREIFRHPHLTADALASAIIAIGTMHAPHRWQDDIEGAYSRLSKREQRRATEAMLDYYYMIREPELALQFCNIRRLNSPAALNFAMDLFLHFNMLDEANKVARKCWRIGERVENMFQLSCLAEALASYYARTRQWQRALEIWKLAPRDQPLSRNAAIGRIEALIAQALGAAHDELDTIELLKKKPSSELQIMVPGIEDSMLDDTRKELLRFRHALEHVLPAKRRHAFGLK
jgi:hypothetical protein